MEDDETCEFQPLELWGLRRSHLVEQGVFSGHETPFSQPCAGVATRDSLIENLARGPPTKQERFLHTIPSCRGDGRRPNDGPGES